MSFAVRRTVSIALVLLALMGPLIGVAGYRLAFERETEGALAEFDRDFAERMLLLEHETASDLESLRMLASLVAHGEVRSDSKLAAIAQDMVSRHPAVQAIEWAPRVSAKDRKAHESQARREGLIGYQIKERDQRGAIVPAAQRTTYFPIRFSVPIEADQAWLGYDLGSENLYRAAIARADSGQAMVSAPLLSVDDRARSDGLLAMVPVLEASGSAGPSLPTRVAGFTIAVFRYEQLLSHWTEQIQKRGPIDMKFWLTEASDGGPGAVLYSYPLKGAAGLQRGSRQVRLSPLGQPWYLIAQPMGSYMSQRRTHQPLAIGVGVFLVWSLLSGLLFALWDWSHHMEERRRTATLRSVLRSVSDGVVVADEDGQFLFINDAARRIMRSGSWQAPPGEWPADFGLYLADTMTPCPPDQLPLIRAMRGESVDEAEMFVRNPGRPDGAWLRVSAAPLLDDSGKVRGGVAAFRDVTSRRRAEETVRRLSSAVDQTADAVVITDLQGRIEYVNPAFETTTGYRSDEVMGETPRVLKSGKQDPSFYRDFWSRILEGEVFRGTVINRKKSGDLYYAEQTVNPIRDASGRITHFVSVIRDMTERRKRLEQETELRLAAVVQRRLFPKDPPQIEGLDLAGAAFPAASVCGDYLDYIPMPDGRLGIAIGDVCGHGIGAALVMAQTRAYLRSFVGAGRDVSDAFRGMNDALCQDLEDNHFVTLFFAELDVSHRHLTYASAGHPPGYILGSNGQVKDQLDSTGVPLGMFPGQEHSSRRALLDPGDMVVLLTDGITECQAPDGRDFGEATTLEVIREHQSKPAREIVAELYQSVRGFAGGGLQLDDITIALAKIALPG